MKLFIPNLGTVLRLTEDWSFPVKSEYRNSDLRRVFNDKPGIDYIPAGTVVTFPKGTVMAVERIYIRRGASDYDSVTFRTITSPDPRLASKKNGGTGSVRFFAALWDVNNMDVEVVDLS